MRGTWFPPHIAVFYLVAERRTGGRTGLYLFDNRPGLLMSIYERNLAICRRCPFHQGGCTGTSCACTADWIDIEDHARSGHCPQHMYPGFSVVHGAAGIAKAVTGTGGATAEQTAQRGAVCAGCEHNQVSLAMVNRCKLCGCLTWAKIRNADEKCPAGKW